MGGSRPRILIIEDNTDNRALLADMLEAIGYEIIEAVDGAEGVKQAFDKNPALILMDLSLPYKDGWTATRELKADDRTSHIPVIALTAHAMVGDRERALEAGCDDYVPKPINLRELVHKIKIYLDDTTASPFD